MRKVWPARSFSGLKSAAVRRKMFLERGNNEDIEELQAELLLYFVGEEHRGMWGLPLAR